MRQMCCNTETTPFFPNDVIKGSAIWLSFPLCLGIMYYERQELYITMGTKSIQYQSPSVS